MKKTKTSDKLGASKDEDKLAIKGSFEDVIRVSVGKLPAPNKGAKKEKK